MKGKKGGKSADKKKEDSEEEEEEKEEEVDRTMKPTRPIAAYIYYTLEAVPKIKADEGIPHKDAMGRAGALWKELSDEQKKKFHKKHDEDVAR